MNGAISEGGCERVVDEAVLLDEREAVEAGARPAPLEVVAAAGAVLDRHVVAREGVTEQLLERLAHRGWDRYSSGSERVSIPVGVPRLATTTAWLPPLSAEKPSSSDSSASTAASGGCIAAATSSFSGSGVGEKKTNSPRPCSEPTT